MAASHPGPAVSPLNVVPVVTSIADMMRMLLISAGVRVGSFSSSSATTPATSGEAADVPLKSPQPSFDAPVLGLIPSSVLLGCTGSMWLGAAPPPMGTLRPVTPHTSGFGPGFWEGLVDLFARNLERWRNGEPLENVVDKRLGY